MTPEKSLPGWHFAAVENLYQQEPRKKAADMRRIGHAIRFAAQHAQPADDLKADPETERYQGRHTDNGNYHEQAYPLQRKQ